MNTQISRRRRPLLETVFVLNRLRSMGMLLCVAGCTQGAPAPATTEADQQVSRKDFLRSAEYKAIERGIAACQSGDVRAAAIDAWHASQYRIELYGSPPQSVNLNKAVYYHSLAVVFDSASGDACKPFADQVKALSISYYQQAYDDGEAMFDTGQKRSLEANRTAILHEILELAPGVIDQRSVRVLEIEQEIKSLQQQDKNAIAQ